MLGFSASPSPSPAGRTSLSGEGGVSRHFGLTLARLRRWRLGSFTSLSHPPMGEGEPRPRPLASGEGGPCYAFGLASGFAHCPRRARQSGGGAYQPFGLTPAQLDLPAAFSPARRGGPARPFGLAHPLGKGTLFGPSASPSPPCQCCGKAPLGLSASPPATASAHAIGMASHARHCGRRAPEGPPHGAALHGLPGSVAKPRVCPAQLSTPRATRPLANLAARWRQPRQPFCVGSRGPSGRVRSRRTPRPPFTGEPKTPCEPEMPHEPTATTFLSPSKYGELFICDHRSTRQCPHEPPLPFGGSLPSATNQYGASARLPKGGAAFCHGVRGSPILI